MLNIFEMEHAKNSFSVNFVFFFVKFWDNKSFALFASNKLIDESKRCSKLRQKLKLLNLS